MQNEQNNDSPFVSYEHGAHFKYSDLCDKLKQLIKLKEEQPKSVRNNRSTNVISNIQNININLYNSKEKDIKINNNKINKNSQRDKKSSLSKSIKFSKFNLNLDLNFKKSEKLEKNVISKGYLPPIKNNNNLTKSLNGSNQNKNIPLNYSIKYSNMKNTNKNNFNILYSQYSTTLTTRFVNKSRTNISNNVKVSKSNFNTIDNNSIELQSNYLKTGLNNKVEIKASLTTRENKNIKVNSKDISKFQKQMMNKEIKSFREKYEDIIKMQLK